MSKILIAALTSAAALASLELDSRSDFYRDGRRVALHLVDAAIKHKTPAEAATADVKSIAAPKVAVAVAPPKDEAAPAPEFRIIDVQITHDPQHPVQPAGYNGHNGNGYNGYNGNGYNGNGNGNGYRNGSYYRNGNGYNGNGYGYNGNGYRNGSYRNGNGNGNGYGNGYRNGNGNGNKYPEVFVCHHEGGLHSANGSRPVLVLQMVPPPHG